MRICPNCNSGNKENAVLCTECGSSILKAYVDHVDYLEKKTQKEQKNHTIKMRLHYTLFPILGIVYLFLSVKTLYSETTLPSQSWLSILFLVIGYLNLHHPKLLFNLEHIWTIDNLDDVELSNFHLLSTRILGYGMISAAFMILIIYL